MRPQITNPELYYLAIPGKVEEVVCLILDRFAATPLEAVSAFYNSPTYNKLEDATSGYWQKDAKFLFDDFLISTGRSS